MMASRVNDGFAANERGFKRMYGSQTSEQRYREGWSRDRHVLVAGKL